MLPTPVRAGDIVGFHFPTSSAQHPHPGIVLKTAQGDAERARHCAQRGIADIPGAQICLLLMVSHSPPGKGEYGEIVPIHHRDGTLLDATGDLYVCYRHYDLGLVPGYERSIASIGGPYLGRLKPEALLYYKSQLTAVQDFLRGRSFLPPKRVFVA